MNRLILTFLLLSLVYIKTGYSCFHHGHGHGPHRHGWHHNHGEKPAETATEAIESFNNAEGALKNICKSTSKIQPVITYGNNGCLIKYPLTSTDVNVDIQITNTVLKTSVTNKSDATEVFTDLRVLPDILNFSKASWWFLYGNLNLMIPYTIPLNSEFTADCGVVSNTVISVPFAVDSQFQLRFGYNDN